MKLASQIVAHCTLYITTLDVEIRLLESSALNTISDNSEKSPNSGSSSSSVSCVLRTCCSAAAVCRVELKPTSGFVLRLLDFSLDNWADLLGTCLAGIQPDSTEMREKAWFIVV